MKKLSSVAKVALPCSFYGLYVGRNIHESHSAADDSRPLITNSY